MIRGNHSATGLMALGRSGDIITPEGDISRGFGPVTTDRPHMTAGVAAHVIDRGGLASLL